MGKIEIKRNLSDETAPVGSDKGGITDLEKDKYTLDDECKVKELLLLFV